MSDIPHPVFDFCHFLYSSVFVGLNWHHAGGHFSREPLSSFFRYFVDPTFKNVDDLMLGDPDQGIDKKLPSSYIYGMQCNNWSQHANN